MSDNARRRALTEDERRLLIWMLEHGKPEAKAFLDQVDRVEVTPWRCSCGCASLNFEVRGRDPAPPGVHTLGDFVVGHGEDMAGIFVFENHGTLSGIEVYGFAHDAPRELPRPESLRTWEAAGDELLDDHR